MLQPQVAFAFSFEKRHRLADSWSGRGPKPCTLPSSAAPVQPALYVWGSAPVSAHVSVRTSSRWFSSALPSIEIPVMTTPVFQRVPGSVTRRLAPGPRARAGGVNGPRPRPGPRPGALHRPLPSSQARSPLLTVMVLLSSRRIRPSVSLSLALLKPSAVVLRRQSPPQCLEWKALPEAGSRAPR